MSNYFDLLFLFGYISVVYVDCPSDFTYNASMNGCYRVVTRNLEWSVAGLECRSLHKDAHLLVINDAAEQTAVAQLLDSINGLCVCQFDASSFQICG